MTNDAPEGDNAKCSVAPRSPPAERVEVDVNRNFDKCFPKASSCRGVLSWQVEGRRWLDECRSSSQPPLPPLGDGDAMLYDVREVLGGSGNLSRKCREAGLKVRSMVDLATHWNLIWRDHQLELLRQVRTEPATVSYTHLTLPTILRV